MANRACGVDLSKYDLRFNPALATEPLDFVIQRISYGMVRDQAFEIFLPGVLQVPIRGGYHYLSSAVPWFDAARRYLDIAGDRYHFHNCDFERLYNNVNAAFRDSALKWIYYVAEQTKQRTLLYTNIDLYNIWFAAIAAVAKIPLWLSWYGRFWPFIMPNPANDPLLPRNRSTWHFWQYWDRGPGTKYGAGRPHAIDLDVFNGTPEQLRSWLGQSPTQPIPQPPPEEVAVKTTFVALVNGQNIRSGPATSHPATGQLKAGQVLYPVHELAVVSPSEVWARFDIGWVAMTHGGTRYLRHQ